MCLVKPLGDMIISLVMTIELIQHSIDALCRAFEKAAIPFKHPIFVSNDRLLIDVLYIGRRVVPMPAIESSNVWVKKYTIGHLFQKATETMMK